MWTALALVAALGPTLGQQGDSLKLSNVRSTYGVLGPERKENKLLPGDVYFVAFDIEGIKSDEAGKVLYSMGMQITNMEGKVVYGEEPRKLEAYNALGGNRIPAFAHALVGFNLPAGPYTMKVTVTDRSTKASQTLTRTFDVLEKNFGLVSVMTSYDPDGRVSAPAGGVVGQILWVNFAAVGWGRDPSKKSDVAMEMRILDESGNPTVAKPATFESRDAQPESAVAIPASASLPLTRPGKFTVKLTASDRVTKKQSEVSFPLVVVEQKATEGESR
jgi:hypothetical protein